MDAPYFSCSYFWSHKTTKKIARKNHPIFFSNSGSNDYFYSPVTDSSQKIIYKFTQNLLCNFERLYYIKSKKYTKSRLRQRPRYPVGQRLPDPLITSVVGQVHLTNTAVYALGKQSKKTRWLVTNCCAASLDLRARRCVPTRPSSAS